VCGALLMGQALRRGQLKMTETIAILIVFFLLVMFGLIFFTQIQKSSFEQKQVGVASERALSVSLHALFLPELRCSKGDNVPIKDCIDVYKLAPAKEEMSKNEDYYFDLLRFANITVIEQYPCDDSLDDCMVILYENVKEDFRRKARTPIPVGLYDPVTKDYRYGVLTIEVYS
jgi:hypothetical protein